MSDWSPTAVGYQHPCCGPIDFHDFQADPYLRPLLAICEGCGRVWEREKPRQAWREAAAGAVALSVSEPEEDEWEEPERRAA